MAGKKVEIRTDDNVLPHLDVRKSSDTLKICFKKGNYSLKNCTLEARVTMPTLKGIDLSGASTAKITGFDAEGMPMGTVPLEGGGNPDSMFRARIFPDF